MANVKAFAFNPFSENTYVLWDETGECVIFDPGCFDRKEQLQLDGFIKKENLRPVRLLNTHCHLDHIFGNAFVARQWGLSLEAHAEEQLYVERFGDICRNYGIPWAEPTIPITHFLEPGVPIVFGNTQLDTLFTPGHSPGSISFYCKEAGFVIAGDVLFRESIGRTDLKGGNHGQLLESIRSQLFPLPAETVVYSGHGPATTIGHEQRHNPFLQ